MFAGANFKKHKEEMMKRLSGQQASMSPISVDTASHKSSGGSASRSSGGASSSSSSTVTSSRAYGGGLSLSSPHMHSPASSVSPKGVLIG